MRMVIATTTWPLEVFTQGNVVASGAKTHRGDRWESWDVSHPTFLRVGFVPPNNFDPNVLSSRVFTVSYPLLGSNLLQVTPLQ